MLDDERINALNNVLTLSTNEKSKEKIRRGGISCANLVMTEDDYIKKLEEKEAKKKEKKSKISMKKKQIKKLSVKSNQKLTSYEPIRRSQRLKKNSKTKQNSSNLSKKQLDIVLTSPSPNATSPSPEGPIFNYEGETYPKIHSVQA